MTSRSPRDDALRIAATYAALAAAWILGSDVLLRQWVADPERGMLLESVKGLGFALVTGGLLFWWVHRRMREREEELRNLRTLTDHVPDLIFRLRVHPTLAFEYVSPAAVELGGFTPEEHYRDPQRVLDAVHPDDRPRLQHLLLEPEAVEETVELRWIHRDGQTVIVEFRVTRHRDADGRVVLLEGVGRDVTARRKAEQRNALLATALDAADEAVYITDAEGDLEYVNPAFTAITGYEPREVLGRNPRLLQSGEQGPEFYERLWTTISAGRAYRGELVNRRKDGALYEQEVAIAPVRAADDDRITHYVAVARDVTVRNEMEEQLRRSYTADAIGQMAAGISHDFRNLLNVIQVNAQLLARDLAEAGSPEAARQADGIDEAAREGAELVGQLLTLSREHRVVLEPLDVGRAVAGMEATLRAVLPESVALRLTTPAGLRAEVDDSALHRILLNLARNASEAMPAGGVLTIQVAATSGRQDEGVGASTPSSVHVRVRDTGTGMDERVRTRLFEAFFTTKEEGTGLGLAMVKSLMDQHGGSIQVASTPGEGTTFDLSFPRLAEAAAAEEESGRAATTDLPIGTERILVVEDEAPLRRAAERVLERLGYSVRVACNGREALEAVDQAEVAWDLILTDLVMPEMGGKELYDSLLARGTGVPLVFMSGYGPGEGSVPGGGGRSGSFLQKPWTVEDLAWKVRTALDGRVA